MLNLLIIIFFFITSFCVAQTPTKRHDSVTVAVSALYSDPSGFKKFFLGSNYRNVWETPVKLPVFNIVEKGFTITELGGGQQTKSLRMTDKGGKEWVLRTVDKDVEKALPIYLQHTLAQRVTQDMVSAAHPFAPLTVTSLAKAIGLIVPYPTFYFVPDDAYFGAYQKLFANTVCLLELREPTPDNSKTKSTETLLGNLEDQNNHLVIQQAVLKARLLDMLIGDWDRHSDQWRWGIVDSGRRQYYYAIPRDRDQAFFYSNGFLVKVARLLGLRHLVGFKKNLRALTNLNYKSWRFDATLLNDLDKKDWTRIITEVQHLLTDNVIDSAVKKMPPEVYFLGGPMIAKKLKNRRNELLKAGLKYYGFISKNVSITGSNEAELFTVSKQNDETLIQIFETTMSSTGGKIYERAFAPKETIEIELKGFGGDDKFVIYDDVNTSIRLKIYGGPGNDTYSIKGTIKNTIYDSSAENNKIENTSKTKIKMR